MIKTELIPDPKLVTDTLYLQLNYGVSVAIILEKIDVVMMGFDVLSAWYAPLSDSLLTLTCHNISFMKEIALGIDFPLTGFIFSDND